MLRRGRVILCLWFECGCEWVLILEISENYGASPKQLEMLKQMNYFGYDDLTTISLQFLPQSLHFSHKIYKFLSIQIRTSSSPQQSFIDFLHNLLILFIFLFNPLVFSINSDNFRLIFYLICELIELFCFYLRCFSVRIIFASFSVYYSYFLLQPYIFQPLH